MGARIPASEQTHQRLEALRKEGVADGDARSELFKLAVRKIVEEALEAEVSDVLGRQVDLQSGTIRLDPGQAKNEEGRVVYLPADLQVLVAAQVKQVRALERKLERIIPHLLPHLRGRHRGSGSRISTARGRGPAGARRSGRCSGTTSGARRSGIW
jgi:hypothetical protein